MTEAAQMTTDTVTVETKNEEVSKAKVTVSKIPYLTTKLSTNNLKGLPSVYIDPSVKSKVCIRYGVIESIGNANIKVRPFNKFNNSQSHNSKSLIKASELGINFIELTGVNSKGESVTVIIQEDIVNIK